MITAEDAPSSRTNGAVAPKGKNRLGRVGAVDVLRGTALGAMVIYHVVWDLHALRLVDADPGGFTAFRWSGHGIAATFLFLSGLGLRLAEQAGRSMRHQLLRLAILALAALGVTAATALVLPDAMVRFGILHCLLVTNVVGLALRRWPSAALVMAGACCLALPLVWPWRLPPAWAWLGLSDSVPTTLDFRPVLPWLALPLFGLAAGRTPLPGWLAAWRPRHRLARVAAIAGRHSLAVYLAHQPILWTLCWLLATAAGVDSSPATHLGPAEAAAFLTECTRTCHATGEDDVLCRSTCHCVLTVPLAAGPPELLARLTPAAATLGRSVETCLRSVPADTSRPGRGGLPSGE